jgi:hypothetical protein
MEECLICVNIFPVNEFVIFECKHEVCITCFSKLLEQNKPCPFCRSIIDIPLLEIHTPTHEEPQQPIEYRIGYFCGKWLLLITTLSTFFYFTCKSILNKK